MNRVFGPLRSVTSDTSLFTGLFRHDACSRVFSGRGDGCCRAVISSTGLFSSHFQETKEPQLTRSLYIRDDGFEVSDHFVFDLFA